MQSRPPASLTLCPRCAGPLLLAAHMLLGSKAPVLFISNDKFGELSLKVQGDLFSRLAPQLNSVLGAQDAMDVAAARSRELPPLQSVAELTSAFEPPTRGAAPAAASAAPSAAGGVPYDLCCTPHVMLRNWGCPCCVC